MSEDDQMCSMCNCGGDEIEYLITCRECNSDSMMFCKNCCRSHLQMSPDHSKGMVILCQECENIEVEATFYCGSCGQILCTQCDQRIHNKCKRAKHTRQQLNLQRDLQIQIIILIDEPLANIINSKKAAYDTFIDKLQKKRIKNDKTSLVVVFRNTSEEILNFDLHYQWEQFERTNGQSEKFLNTIKFMPQLSTCVFFKTQSENYQMESQALGSQFPNLKTIFTSLPTVSPPPSAEKQILLQQKQQHIQHMQQVQQQFQHMFPIQQLNMKQNQTPPILQPSKSQIQQNTQQIWSNQNQNQSVQEQQQILSMNQHISQQNPILITNGSFNSQQQQQAIQQVQFSVSVDKNIANFSQNGNNNQYQNKEESKASQNNSSIHNQADDEQGKNGDSKSANESHLSKKKKGNKSLNAMLNPCNSQNMDKKNSQFPNKNQSFDDGFQIYSSSESHSNEGNQASNLNSKFLLINNSNMNNSQNNSNLSNNNIINNNKPNIPNQNSIFNHIHHHNQNNSIQQIQQQPIGDNSGQGNNSLLRNNTGNSNQNIQILNPSSNNNNNSSGSPNGNCFSIQMQQRARNNSSNHKHSLQTNSENITNPQLDYGNINSSINNTNSSLNQHQQNNSNNNNNFLPHQLTSTSNQMNPKNIDNTSRSSNHSANQKQVNNSRSNKNILGSTQATTKQKKSKKENGRSNNTSYNRLSRNTSSGSIRNLNTSKGSIDGCTNNILNNSLNQGLNKNSSSTALEGKTKNTHNTYTCGMPFQQFQNPKTTPVQNQQIAIRIQKQLSILAEKGELMILKEVFLKMIQNNVPGCTENVCIEIFEEAEQAGIIHQTTRTFANSAELHFVSLKLEYISLQSLIWIIKSIKLDLMTPTDKLILSRIKECFGLKLTPKSWDMILNHLQHPNYIQNYENGQNPQDLPQLIVQKVNDPLMGADTTVIYIKGQEWIPEDKGKIDLDNNKSWKLFKDFLEQYFKQPIANDGSEDNKQDSSISSKKNSYFTTKITKSSKKSQQQQQLLQQQQQQQQANQSSSSITTPLSNPTSGEQDTQTVTNNANNSSNTNNNQSQQELRAIPGGRYGCVQYVKYCGPPQLQELSLGKLSLFVQEAINTGIIRYHRTLLVKYTYNEENSALNESSSVFSLENSVHILEKSAYGLQRDVTVKHLQDALLDILSEHPKGVSLVQIPQFLKKKVFFQFNLQDLGFPKLKNFIQTIPEKVQIELAGTNNSYAILKNNSLKGSKNNQQFLSQGASSENQSSASSPISKNSIVLRGQQTNNNNSQQPVQQQKQQQLSEQQQQKQLQQQQSKQQLSSQSIQQQSQTAQQQQQQPQQIDQQQQQQLSQNQTSKLIQGYNLSSGIFANQQSYLAQQQNNQEFQNLFMQTQNGGNNEQNQKQAAMVLETLNELLEKVKQNIQLILKQNPNGIHIKDLYSALSKSLGVHFQFGLFGSMDFLGFLTSYAESIIDIECKQNYYVIYQKNHRFGLEGKLNSGTINPIQQNKTGYNNGNNISNSNNFQAQLTQINQIAGNISQIQQSQHFNENLHNPQNIQGNYMNISSQNMMNFLQQNKLTNQSSSQSQQSGSNSKKRSMAISQSASNILNNGSSTNTGSNFISSNNQFINNQQNAIGPQQSPQQQQLIFMNQQQQQFMANPNIFQQQFLQSQLAQQYQMYGSQNPHQINNGVIGGNSQNNPLNESPLHVRSLSQHSNNKNNNNNLISGNGVRSNNIQSNSNYINPNNQYHYHPHHPQYMQQQGVQGNNAYFTPFYNYDFSQYQSTHSRNPSKNIQRGEQSSMDIKENIGLIEDILQDTDENYSFRTQTDKTFMGDDNLTSFNWSISILNPHYQSDRQREISTEFEQFPCDLSKITNKGGGSGSGGGVQNIISSAQNDRVITSNTTNNTNNNNNNNNNTMKNSQVNPLSSYQQSNIQGFQNVLTSTNNSQYQQSQPQQQQQYQQQQQQYMNYNNIFVNPSIYSSSSYQGQSSQYFNPNNSFTKESTNQDKKL